MVKSMTRSLVNAVMLGAIAMTVSSGASVYAASPERMADYYELVDVVIGRGDDSRATNWQPPPDGLVLEPSGLAFLPDGRLAVAIRKGEIWLLDGIADDPVGEIRYQRFAAGLHEPLGLLYKDDSLFTVQRSELTRLRDHDGDDVADEYQTFAKGWGLTGHYHEFAYGPKLDHQGNFWVTLNLGLNLKPDQQQQPGVLEHPQLGYRQQRWRGWGLKVTPDGKLHPVCGGMRSPCGIGINTKGDAFYTDQQGNWVATNSLHHMRDGVFFHHPEALASAEQPGSPLKGITSIPDGVPYPQALRELPSMVPPAVWFPYKKVGQSATDILLDSSEGKFGPFAGQFFVGEFTHASVNRVFLERVEGEYQGACFPFMSGFACAVLRLEQGEDGSVYAGLTNRGWSSLGTASYGIQRIRWTGKQPFEVQQMRAKSDGFELRFTQPVDPQTAGDPASYAMQSYTYLYHQTYGSDEIQAQTCVIRDAVVSEDRLSVKLTVEGLRPLYVHELLLNGVRNAEGQPLLNQQAYYTLNRIPNASSETNTSTEPGPTPSP